MKLSNPQNQGGWRFTVLWTVLWPIRYYLRCFPIQRGKGLLRKLLILPILPTAPAQFETVLAGGARIRLQYRETIGLSTLLYGPFENAELLYLTRLVQPGDNVFDIGANIGLFSVVLGRAVGHQGRVIAAEPVPENAVRATANFEINQLTNVQLINAAIGATAGTIRINLANDLAYPSVVEVAESRGIGKSINVPQRTLDNIWLEMGSPPIRFVKIDVEGYELEVLRGAVSLVRQAQPVFLLEANDAVALGQLRQFLDPLGYQFIQPPGFTVHNYLAMPSHLSQKIGAT